MRERERELEHFLPLGVCPAAAALSSSPLLLLLFFRALAPCSSSSSSSSFPHRERDNMHLAGVRA